MKQYNFEMTNTDEVENALGELLGWLEDVSYKSILFHIYTIKFDEDQIHLVQEMILDVFPNALIGGTSSNGDICDGHLAEYGLVLSVSVFESTDVKVNLFDCTPGEETAVGTAIRNVIDSTPGIKAAEILITLKSITSHMVLDEVEKCNENVKIFGGGSAAEDISDSNTKVISNDTVCTSGALLITYSGPDLHVSIKHALGWKPLGKDLTVTKIEGKRLYELDKIPAGKIYSRYLDIKADETFFANILEFPIMSIQHGFEVLRLPFSCDTEDDSILLAADVPLGSTVNLSYGDPSVIKGDVNNMFHKVQKFAPQAIFLYSCGVRRLYWKYLINKETGIFSTIAPVSGFYSSGEIMRMDKYLIEHHVTLIAISMREGGEAEANPTGVGDKKIEMTEEQKMHGQLSMVRRLANFINVTSAELRAANEELQKVADSDALTGLYNRRMMDRLLATGIDHSNKFNVNLILGIIDIDDFKEINDTFGHDSGDLVLKTIASVIREEIVDKNAGFCGRWGGEEFTFMISKSNIDEAKDVVEILRKRVAKTYFEGIGNRTISIGMTMHIKGENTEDLFKRADDALYEAKGTGKNKICII